MGVLTDIMTGGGSKIGGKLLSKFAKKRSGQKLGQLDKSPASSGGDNSTGADEMGTPSYKRGGKVRKTGLARVHKGERVLTAKQAKSYRKKVRSKRR